MKNKIIELLNQGLLKLEGGRQELRAKNVFHPSALGDCLRKLYYSMVGIPRAGFTPKTLRIFDNGHSAHERLSRYFSQAGVLMAEEWPVSNEEWNIKGHVDAVINIDGEPTLVDFKTIKNYPFQLTKSGKKKLNRTYLYQINVYMWLMNMKRAFFIFENKNDQELFIEEVKFSPEVVEDAKRRIKAVRQALLNKTPPEREYDKKKDWNCNYCGWYHICYGEKK